jgi:NAD(P)-dependent dehydrogenase (short-subunit alcohol dehydrogenase family)
MGQLSGKVAIVTGAASGIGRAAARRFAQEGAKVCAADLNLDGAEKTAKDIKAAGGEAFAVKIDVSSEADNAALVTETVNRYGGLDVAYFNAGYYGQVADIMTTSVENFDKVIGINLRGVFLGIRAVANVLRSGGSVIATASSAGLAGFLEGPSYSASKHGVVGLVKSASHAFAKKGLRINAICPGGVATGMMVPGGVPDLMTPPDEFSPVPYRGQAASEHIAEVALFLASNRSVFMNGAAVAVDGGLTSSFAIPEDSPNKPK